MPLGAVHFPFSVSVASTFVSVPVARGHTGSVSRDNLVCCYRPPYPLLGAILCSSVAKD